MDALHEAYRAKRANKALAAFGKPTLTLIAVGCIHKFVPNPASNFLNAHTFVKMATGSIAALSAFVWGSFISKEIQGAADENWAQAISTWQRRGLTEANVIVGDDAENLRLAIWIARGGNLRDMCERAANVWGPRWGLEEMTVDDLRPYFNQKVGWLMYPPLLSEMTSNTLFSQYPMTVPITNAKWAAMLMEFYDGLPKEGSTAFYDWQKGDHPRPNPQQFITTGSPIEGVNESVLNEALFYLAKPSA